MRQVVMCYSELPFFIYLLFLMGPSLKEKFYTVLNMY